MEMGFNSRCKRGITFKMSGIIKNDKINFWEMVQFTEHEEIATQTFAYIEYIEMSEEKKVKRESRIIIKKKTI